MGRALEKDLGVDVATCLTGGGPIAILAFTLDPTVIDTTLRRIRNNGLDPRAGSWQERAPPVATTPL